jgi:uncharacterized protein (PEP-CTERM system associated)
MHVSWRLPQGRGPWSRGWDGLGYFARLCLSSAVLALMAASQPAQAQSQPAVATLPVVGTVTENSTQPQLASPAEDLPTRVPAPARPQPRRGYPIINQGPPGPEFQAGAAVNVSDSYVTNATGFPGAAGGDYLTTLGFSTYVHEHSRRLSLDGTYSFGADFYARNSIPTQISNNLQAVLNADVVPNYLTMSAKAFAQPIIISDLGFATANNRIVPNGFSNSYGYFVNPDLHFRLDSFATSETVPNFGQVFFTNPPGSIPILTIPGLNAPQDATVRGLTEKISSGTDFDRMNWDLIGSLSETARTQSLLSEKAAIANLRYALGHEFSLLATGGYDAISNSTGLNQNVSGPVALGGFGLTFGTEFSLQFEAGQRYNDLSFFGNLRYEITPSALLVATVNDAVQTPEGQLLNNLTNLPARQDGSLGAARDVYGNGSASSLSSFNLQSQGNVAQDQNIARYQTIIVSLSEDFIRNHVSLNANATRRTILSGIFIGPRTTESWSVQGVLGRDLTPLLRASIGGSYGVDNQFGGDGSTLGLDGQLTYSLSQQTSIYLSAQYRNRNSSPTLQALSPFTGNLSDFRATIGLSHAL